MNPVIETLMSRKSVRDFLAKLIPEETVDQILKAAIQAPSAENQQLYRILRISDQPLKERLAAICDNQPFIAAAPLVLIFCADFQRYVDAYGQAGCDLRQPGMGEWMWAVSDCLIAAQNAVIAAESLGVGSCYIGDIMQSHVETRALLGLPEYGFPAAMVIFGYPTEQQQARKQPARTPREALINENRYERYSGKQLEVLFLAGQKIARSPTGCELFALTATTQNLVKHFRNRLRNI